MTPVFIEKQWRTLAVGGAILILGIFLRLYHVDTIFFNGDEPIHQIRISYQPLPFVLANNNGPLFSILAHFLLSLGPLELMSRLVSVVSGILALLMTYVLGKAMYSSAEGLMAALFMAFSHLHIFYSQNSRSYALLTLLLLLSLFTFLRAAREGKTRDWILYALFTLLSLYTQIIAALILPATALAAVFLSLEARPRRIKPAARPSVPILKKYIVWTGCSLVLAVLLYLPCSWVRGIFLGALERGFKRPADAVRLSLASINDIVRFQISPAHSWLYGLTAIFVVFGLVFRFRAGRFPSILGFLFVVLPWLFYAVSHPRPTVVHSLYRYTMFSLPLIFILAARGIHGLGRNAASLLFRSRGRRVFAAGVVMCVLAVVMASGFFSDLKSYVYVDYWRQGSFRFDRDVKNYLREHALRDAVVYLDIYPYSSLILMLNPLARDISPDELAAVVRENYVRPPEGREVMIHVLGWYFFEEFVAGRKAELWAVIPKASESSAALRSGLNHIRDVALVDLERFTLIHFQKNEQSIADKMALLADVLLTAPAPDPVRRRQRSLLAAKAYFMTREAADGISALSAFNGIRVSPADDARHSGSRSERLLANMLHLSAQNLRSIYEQRALLEIQHLAFLHANNLLSAGRLDDAAKTYEAVLRIGNDYDARVCDRLVALGDQYERRGEAPQSFRAWETAARLDPKREDIAARLDKIK
jgi:hypothetical protein